MAIRLENHKIHKRSLASIDDGFQTRQLLRTVLLKHSLHRKPAKQILVPRITIQQLITLQQGYFIFPHLRYDLTQLDLLTRRWFGRHYNRRAQYRPLEHIASDAGRKPNQLMPLQHTA
eukprot:179274-Amphidinium_carterae.1